MRMTKYRISLARCRLALLRRPIRNTLLSIKIFVVVYLHNTQRIGPQTKQGPYKDEVPSAPIRVYY